MGLLKDLLIDSIRSKKQEKSNVRQTDAAEILGDILLAGKDFAAPTGEDIPFAQSELERRRLDFNDANSKFPLDPKLRGPNATIELLRQFPNLNVANKSQILQQALAETRKNAAVRDSPAIQEAFGVPEVSGIDTTFELDLATRASTAKRQASENRAAKRRETAVSLPIKKTRDPDTGIVYEQRVRVDSQGVEGEPFGERVPAGGQDVTITTTNRDTGITESIQTQVGKLGIVRRQKEIERVSTLQKREAKLLSAVAELVRGGPRFGGKGGVGIRTLASARAFVSSFGDAVGLPLSTLETVITENFVPSVARAIRQKMNNDAAYTTALLVAAALDAGLQRSGSRAITKDKIARAIKELGGEGADKETILAALQQKVTLLLKTNAIDEAGLGEDLQHSLESLINDEDRKTLGIAEGKSKFFQNITPNVEPPVPGAVYAPDFDSSVVPNGSTLRVVKDERGRRFILVVPANEVVLPGIEGQ